MHRGRAYSFWRVGAAVVVAMAFGLGSSWAQSTDSASADGARGGDGGVEVRSDGGTREVLESIFIPPIANAPFNLTLATEWARPLGNGGSFTVSNVRPIRRDSAGRIYEERWYLTPKGSKVKSTQTAIQIGDPIAHTWYNCFPAKKICELLDYTTSQRYAPSSFQSGPLPDGKGMRTHEDLGLESLLGVAVHVYRDSTVLNPGVMGNDLPMTTVREFSYSAELGLNLRSVLESPLVGKQTFTVTGLSTSEPDANYFIPPEGWQIVDHRKSASKAP